MRDKQFIESHVAGHLLKNLPALDILVSVRDPIEQMISNYRHIHRDPANRWHRATKRMSARDFFDKFGHWFTNHQSRYILSAFVPLHAEIDEKGYYAAFAEHFFAAIARIRWLVPTGSIDEFLDLWSIETSRVIPNAAAVVNTATQDGMDVAALRELLVARPHLYPFDALLHELAKDRFRTYRRSIRERLIPWCYPDNSRRACADGAAGIWLTENWYDPEVSDTGSAWWAGPQNRSEVRFRRQPRQTFLGFEVRVVNGIGYDQIEVFAKQGFRPLHTRRVFVHADLTRYWISIESLAVEDDLVLTVPECWAPILSTASDDSVVPCSFLSANWQLTESL